MYSAEKQDRATKAKAERELAETKLARLQGSLVSARKLGKNITYIFSELAFVVQNSHATDSEVEDYYHRMRDCLTRLDDLAAPEKG